MQIIPIISVRVQINSISFSPQYLKAQCFWLRAAENSDNLDLQIGRIVRSQGKEIIKQTDRPNSEIKVKVKRERERGGRYIRPVLQKSAQCKCK